MLIPRYFARRRSGAVRASRARTLGVLVALVALTSMTAVALAAAGTTLATGHAKVNGKTTTVVVNSHGLTLYTLSGETAHHLKCVTRLCFMAWPPYKVSASARLTKRGAVKGRIGRLHRRGAKFFQVTLDGHPLYTFSGDGKRKGLATGDGITYFGGTWHVVSPR
jgi:predicted lipoprotein with Yx(FWY)xxD motif